MKNRPPFRQVVGSLISMEHLRKLAFPITAFIVLLFITLGIVLVVFPVLAVSFIFVSFARYMIIPGLVWAPFAGLIAWYMARARGLPAVRYGVAGAFYSALFLLPWIYLVGSMMGLRFPHSCVRLTYIAVYGSWQLGPMAILEALVYITLFSGYSPTYIEVEAPMKVGIMILLVLMAFGWILTLAIARNTTRQTQPVVRLYGSSRVSPIDLRQQPSTDEALTVEGALIEVKYILPFLGILVSVVTLIPFLNLLDRL